MCSHYFCKYPMQLLANMIRRIIFDDEYEDSIMVFTLENKLVVAMGIDKSNKDLICLERGEFAINKKATRDYMCRHLPVWKVRPPSAMKMRSLPSVTPPTQPGNHFSTSLMTSTLYSSLPPTEANNVSVHVLIFSSSQFQLN